MSETISLLPGLSIRLADDGTYLTVEHDGAVGRVCLDGLGPGAVGRAFTAWSVQLRATRGVTGRNCDAARPGTSTTA